MCLGSICVKSKESHPCKQPGRIVHLEAFIPISKPMTSRGHIPSASEGHSIPPTGMMHHGLFPGLGPVASSPLDQLPPLDMVERKIAAQVAEIQRLARENERLAGTHVAMRQELIAAQKELQMFQAHIGTVRMDIDLHIRGLLDKIAKMEADLRAGEGLKIDLQQAHLEAQGLVTVKQELTAQIQQTSEELQRVQAEIKQIPALHAELDSLRQEHQKLRVAFEYEKGANMEQVQQMHGMEKNLVSMAREVEILRAEVSNAEKRARAPNPYGGQYGSPGPTYPSVGKGGGYATDSYGRSQVQKAGATGEGINPYDSGGAASIAGSGSSVTIASGGSGIRTAGGWGGAYDAVRGAPLHGRR